jgi:hypothetical protein
VAIEQGGEGGLEVRSYTTSRDVSQVVVPQAVFPQAVGPRALSLMLRDVVRRFPVEAGLLAWRALRTGGTCRRLNWVQPGGAAVVIKVRPCLA